MFRLSLSASRSAVQISRTPLGLFRAFRSSTICANGDNLYNALITEFEGGLRGNNKDGQAEVDSPLPQVISKTRKSTKTKKDGGIDHSYEASDAVNNNNEAGSTTDAVKEDGQGKKKSRLRKLRTLGGPDDFEGPAPPKRSRKAKPKVRDPPEKKANTVKKKVKSVPSAGEQLDTSAGVAAHGTEQAGSNAQRYLSAQARLKSKNQSGDSKRMNVISNDLCDDILERLGPTLDRHVGCDVLDINPGACVWSSKIHERLKPRTHILIEPDVKLYRPFLDPLLQAPGSKYKLVPKSGIVWGHLENVLSKDYLPFQEPYEKDDPRLEQRNDTLLVVANLGYHPKKAYRGFHSLTTLVLHQFLSAIRTHSLFERYGLVRLLVWVNDEEQRYLVPKDIHVRRKTAIRAELICDINEVASSTSIGNYLRQKYLDLRKAQEVLDKMQSSGVRTPNGRESILVQELLDMSEDLNSGRVDMSGWRHAAELAQLEMEYAAGKIKVYEGEYADQAPGTMNNRYIADHSKRAVMTRKWLRLRHLRYHAKYHQKDQIVEDGRIEDYDAMIALQRAIRDKKVEGLDTAAEATDLEQRKGSWDDEIVENMLQVDRNKFYHALDNRNAFINDPPLLVWDRRDYEPLRVHPDEFVPKRAMCLLDLQPKSLWPILQEDSGRNFDILEFIVGLILISPAQSMKRGLSSLWPGAYEWLVAECPSLTDPWKGGNPDLDMLRTRSVTTEMLKEIVEAWVRWPFKPAHHELIARMGAVQHDDDAIETDGSDD